MNALEWLVSKSTSILMVVVPLLALTGFPKTKIRYRILASAITVLCACSSVLWYESYYVAELYFRDQPRWPNIAGAVLFLIASLVIAWEVFALRLFRWGQNQESNQPPEPMPLTRHG